MPTPDSNANADLSSIAESLADIAMSLERIATICEAVFRNDSSRTAGDPVGFLRVYDVGRD